MVSLVASARVHGFEKVAVTLFFAPHALAREPIEQKTWKLECPSALPCSIFPQNLTKIVQSVQLLCNSLEIEAIKRPMRTSIHFIHYPVLIILRPSGFSMISCVTFWLYRGESILSFINDEWREAMRQCSVTFSASVCVQRAAWCVVESRWTHGHGDGRNSLYAMATSQKAQSDLR